MVLVLLLFAAFLPLFSTGLRCTSRAHLHHKQMIEWEPWMKIFDHSPMCIAEAIRYRDIERKGWLTQLFYACVLFVACAIIVGWMYCIKV